jgi:hypothetical protein
LQVFEEILQEIVQSSLQSGIQFEPTQIVYSVHNIAQVNTDKNQQRQNKGKRIRDSDAGWGVKHQRKVKDVAGKEAKQTKFFYSYKIHVSLNAETGLITSLETTSGEAYDSHHFNP